MNEINFFDLHFDNPEFRKQLSTIYIIKQKLSKLIIELSYTIDEI